MAKPIHKIRWVEGIFAPRLTWCLVDPYRKGVEVTGGGFGTREATCRECIKAELAITQKETILEKARSLSGKRGIDFESARRIVLREAVRSAVLKVKEEIESGRPSR